MTYLPQLRMCDNIGSAVMCLFTESADCRIADISCLRLGHVVSSHGSWSGTTHDTLTLIWHGSYVPFPWSCLASRHCIVFTIIVDLKTYMSYAAVALDLDATRLDSLVKFTIKYLSVQCYARSKIHTFFTKYITKKIL